MSACQDHDTLKESRHAMLPAAALYRVHVFNPDGIHRAIKHDPFLVWAGVSTALPHVGCQHSVCPLVGVLIKLAIQLAHGDGLGVQGHHTHLLKLAGVTEASHSLHHTRIQSIPLVI